MRVRDRAIIFDVDGTLAETEEIHRQAFNSAFHEAGLSWSWDQALYRELLAVTGGKERIRHFIEQYRAEGAPCDGQHEFIKALHARKTDFYTDVVRSGEVELRPGIRAFIDTAQRRAYRLAIATTTSPANVDALLQSTLGEDGLRYFEVICAGDSVPNKKPAPDVYLSALGALQLPAKQCIAIEDSPNGLLAAHAAGIRTVVTPGIYTRGENFSEAAQVIDDLGSAEFAVVESLY